jgi:hypothetical protein
MHRVRGPRRIIPEDFNALRPTVGHVGIPPMEQEKPARLPLIAVLCATSLTDQPLIEAAEGAFGLTVSQGR